jgi:hypothetical protein
MSKAIGSKAVLKIGDAANALVDVSQYTKNEELDRKAAELDATTMQDGAAGNKAFLPGLKEATIKFDGFFDAAFDALLDATLGLAGRNWEFYPQGTGGGAGTNVKYSGTGFVSSYNGKFSTDQLGDAAGEFRISGAVTRALV